MAIKKYKPTSNGRRGMTTYLISLKSQQHTRKVITCSVKAEKAAVTTKVS